MFEVISVIFIILSVGLAIALYRSINRLSFYEDIYGDMQGPLGDLGDNIQGVLSREIYTNDPIIKSFVGQLQEISYYLQQVDENYKFNTLGEEVDES
jgi:hypothetical protein|tara:strand:- start:3320 stop:3610 length:291 start_codon:yes stop_codon:yes gene_type:complete